MNGPVLEWVGWSELTYRLFKGIHQCFYKETARATEWIPEVQLASFLCTVEYTAFKDAGCGQSLIQDTPSHVGSISMLIKTIIRGTEEDLAVVLVQDEQDLAQVFKLTLLLCFGLKCVSNFIQFLDVLFVIQDFIFLLFLLQLLSFFEWFFSRASPTMLS